MSKRNKRSKKGRKARSVDSTSSKRGRDEVTGLFAEVNGQRIISDVTYSEIDSPEGKSFFKGRKNREFTSDGSASFEFELGKDSIIMTHRVIGELSVDGLQQASRDYRQRIAWIGSFIYDKNGALSKASIREVAGWSFGESWNSTSTHEWSSIDKGATINSDSLLSVYTSTNSFPNRVFDYIADYGDGLVMGGPKSDFYNFESSKYFEEGWWDNPFAPNLI